MSLRRFHIETLGCQMNILDSELAAAALLEAGYIPSATRDGADVVLINTCSVRQHAEDKVYSALGRLKDFKKEKPHGLIVVMGCMAQKDQAGIFKRAPHVDLVLGPGQLEQLPRLVGTLRERMSHASNGKKDAVQDTARPATPLLEVSLDRFARTHRHGEIKESFKHYDPRRVPQARGNRFQAMVRIMFGCDKLCTYCIVPSVRGPEQCRDPKEILEEVRQLADQGVLEITLIGQTVNSYRWHAGGKTTELADLLAAVHDIDGLRRIRFLTNYPRGISDRLLDTIRELPRIAPFLHVPAQSGSNAILRRMKRNYTLEEYRDLLDRMYAKVPGASVTSDFIVGFCGETEAEFRETVELVRYGRFKNSFIFKYSERAGTKAAAEFPDDIPEEIKRRRNNELLDVQNAITFELNREMIGRRVEILVDGTTGKTGEENGLPQLSARTACDRIVVFNGDPSLIGRFIEVEIESAAPFTLFAKSLATSPAASIVCRTS